MACPSPLVGVIVVLILTLFLGMALANDRGILKDPFSNSEPKFSSTSHPLKPTRYYFTCFSSWCVGDFSFVLSFVFLCMCVLSQTSYCNRHNKCGLFSFIMFCFCYYYYFGFILVAFTFLILFVLVCLQLSKTKHHLRTKKKLNHWKKVKLDVSKSK